MLKVALTGGIGSGKTAASQQFEKLGIEVIDADLISRELVEPGQPALAEISQAFGADMLSANGQLERKKLRQYIFSQPNARKQLEDILHPRIERRIKEQAEQAQSPYVILVIPLLTETNKNYGADRILLIDTSTTLQKQRVMQRDKCTQEELEQILASQSERKDRQKKADDVILNNSSLEKLQQAVTKMHQQYLNIAV